MSQIITNLRHYNTPALEGIVHPSSNTGYQMDRLPDHQHHQRHGYRVGNPAEPASSNRCSRHHNQRGYVRRAEELTPVQPGVTNTQGRGSRNNNPGASFPIWGTIVL